MSSGYAPEKLCRRCRADYRVDDRCQRCGEPDEVEAMRCRLHLTWLAKQYEELHPWREFMVETLARWSLGLP